ncbi:MAG TPA: hypothetical protein VM778_12120 [Gemmatimonadota bacterium]|nr:hypothetical protein [Gemmatimonadota bacterium]
MTSAPVDPVRVVVLALDERIASSVLGALDRAGIANLRWEPGDPGAPGRPPVDPDLFILNGEGLNTGVLIRAGHREGWLRASIPVIVLAPSPVARDDRVAWLEAGAWEIVALPLDDELFGLQVRNLLRGYPESIWAHSDDEPYTRRALVRVTEENLALAHRYRRPLCAAAFCLDWGGRRADEEAIALLRRLAVLAHEAVRRSDLVGVTASGTLVVLLPDTDAAGARIFSDRLIPVLEARLRSWGFVGRVIGAQISVEAATSTPPEDFLAAADRSVA